MLIDTRSDMKTVNIVANPSRSVIAKIRQQFDQLLNAPCPHWADASDGQVKRGGNVLIRSRPRIQAEHGQQVLTTTTQPFERLPHSLLPFPSFGELIG